MKLTEYSFGVRKAPTHVALSQYQADSQSLEGYLSQYIHLPENVKKWAKPIVGKLTERTTSVYRKAELVAGYVRASATYNTETPRMNVREKNFAQWFLESSDTGYCVHFATAATVLLQAVGVPARYVTGYMVQAVAGEEIQVTGEQAHAWCEYWLPGFGWTVLEATPPDLRPDPTEATQLPTTQPEQVLEQTLPENVPGGISPPQSVTVTRNVWRWAVLLLGLLVCFWGQYVLRCVVRKKRLQKGSANAQALSHWQYATLLAQHLQEQPPHLLQALAEKAKFSQYGITPEELAEFTEYENRAILCLKKKNVFVQMYHRFVLALYNG
jgi:hypothetical protein